MVVVTMVVFAFAFIISSYKGKLTIVPTELQAELISLRFTNIDECFAYKDNATHRVFPGIIDMDKFTDEQFKMCYLTEDTKGIKTYNFRLKLEREGIQIMSNNYFHDDDFTIFREVLVRRDDNIIQKDRLLIYVQEKI